MIHTTGKPCLISFTFQTKEKKHRTDTHVRTHKKILHKPVLTWTPELVGVSHTKLQELQRVSNISGVHVTEFI